MANAKANDKRKSQRRPFLGEESTFRHGQNDFPIDDERRWCATDRLLRLQEADDVKKARRLIWPLGCFVGIPVTGTYQCTVPGQVFLHLSPLALVMKRIDWRNATSERNFKLQMPLRFRRSQPSHSLPLLLFNPPPP